MNAVVDYYETLESIKLQTLVNQLVLWKYDKFSYHKIESVEDEDFIKNDKTKDHFVVAWYTEENDEKLNEFRKLGIKCLLIFSNTDQIKLAFNKLKSIKKSKYTWSRFSDNGYEVTSRGDLRYSPFFMRDPVKNKSIENIYQLDIKLYGLFGYTNWDQVKGKAPLEIIPVESNWFRPDVQNDKDYLYLFTDNLNRTSGTHKIPEYTSYFKKFSKGKLDLCYPWRTQAVIRGLDNAAPITTMQDQFKTQLTDLDKCKDVWREEIDYIKSKIRSGKYKGIKFSTKHNVYFGRGRYSDFNDEFFDVLSDFLLEIGIDNRNPDGVSPFNSDNYWRLLTEVYLDYFRYYPALLYELGVIGLDRQFTDMFATSSNSQAAMYCKLCNKFFYQK